MNFDSNILFSQISPTFQFPWVVPLIIALGFVLLTLAAWWKIFIKSGFSGYWAILMLIPIVNFFIFLILAFSDWPIFSYFQEQLNNALVRQRQGIAPEAGFDHDLLFPRYKSISETEVSYAEKEVEKEVPKQH